MIHYGMNRFVFTFGHYVIKFPIFWRDDQAFIRGLLSNILERVRYKLSHKHPALMPIIYCFPFGLFLIMRRCPIILRRKLTTEELEELPFINIDNNERNMGIYKHHIVWFDYGNPDMRLKEIT